MSSEEKVLAAIHKGEFEEAVSLWRKFVLGRKYPIDHAMSSLYSAARLLEARLIYRAMMRQDDEFAGALDRFRRWLLEQQTAITNWTEIGAGQLVLPDNLRVGHKEIDRDHEILFGMANDIRDALRQGDTQHVVAMAERLLDEMLAHFDREERILERTGHPDASAHAKYHSHLRQRVPQIRAVLEDLAKGGDDSRATFDILITFLVNDPIAADMDLRPFFANNPQHSMV